VNVKKQAGMWLLATMAGFASTAGAHVADTSYEARMTGVAQHWKAQLGPNINRLSPSAQTLFHLSEQWEKFRAIGAAIGKRGGGAGSFGGTGAKLAPGGPGSAPNLSFTRFSGAVQSET